MISFHNIASLLKQGFTEEQIQKIDTVFSASPTATAPADPEPNPAPTPAPDPDPAPPKDKPAKAEDPAQQQPDPQPQPPMKEESETEKMLKEMLGIMRKGNINQMQVNTPQAETAEQILARVLNPDM